MIRACIFDMDGVIVDTAKYHFNAWRELAKVQGIDIDEKFNEKLKGLSRVDSLEKILEEGNLFLDNDTKLRLMDQKNMGYLDLISDMDENEILPGASDFLKSLKEAGIKMALGSSSKNAALILKKVGLWHYFDEVIDGTKITLFKPDPEVFMKGSKALGIPPEETVVFEDAESGVKAAIKGGFHVVGIGSEGSLKEALYTIPSLAEMNLEKLVAIGKS